MASVADLLFVNSIACINLNYFTDLSKGRAFKDSHPFKNKEDLAGYKKNKKQYV